MDSTNILQHLLLSFRKGAVLEEPAGGPPLLKSPPLQLSFEKATAGVLAAARGLATGKETLDGLLHLATSAEARLEPDTLFQSLNRWNCWGLLCHTLPWQEGELISIVPNSPEYEFRYDPPDPQQTYIVSRFAYCRRMGDVMLLESPRGHGRILLHDARAHALLHSLASGATCHDLCEAFEDLSASTIALFMGLLHCSGVLSQLSEDGDAEEGSPALRQWAFHDLVFHSRSRWGRHAEAYGKTEPFRGEISPCPAVKPAMSDDRTSLAVPDLDAIAQRDVPLVTAMESRRSVRSFAGPSQVVGEVMDRAQLSEFLFRTARSEPSALAGTRSYDHDQRPYPSGGSCYELELYLVVNVCHGLVPGLYHYQPREHALYHLSDLGAPERELLIGAYRGTGAPPNVAGTSDSQLPLQVLIIVAARFQRVSWAYESIAYSLIQKHVGVMFQSMCLVATSMGLGTCALGGGNTDAFAKATGLDYYEEGSVGELLLGVPRSDG